MWSFPIKFAPFPSLTSVEVDSVSSALSTAGTLQIERLRVRRCSLRVGKETLSFFRIFSISEGCNDGHDDGQDHEEVNLELKQKIKFLRPKKVFKILIKFGVFLPWISCWRIWFWNLLLDELLFSVVWVKTMFDAYSQVNPGLYTIPPGFIIGMAWTDLNGTSS